MSGPGTTPSGGPPAPLGRASHLNLGRAVVLLVVAVVAGVLLLHVATEGPSVTTAGSSATTTTTTAPAHPTTTTTKPSAAVKVLVANGSTTTGAAGYFTTELNKAGWSTLTPVTAPAASSSAVYYAAGQSVPALAVAKSLGLSSTAVHPLTSAVAVPGATAAEVVVVVGPDLAAHVSTTTTT